MSLIIIIISAVVVIIIITHHHPTISYILLFYARLGGRSLSQKLQAQGRE